MLIGVSRGHGTQDAAKVESAFARQQPLGARLMQEALDAWSGRSAGASHIWT
jgi:hypothetical protein